MGYNVFMQLKNILGPLLSKVTLATSALVLVVFVIPHMAFAASTLHWTPFTENIDTGDRTYGTELFIEHGGTYEAPLNQLGEAFIQVDALVFSTEGVLFYIPNPDSPTREFVPSFDGFSFPYEGVYELDIYKGEAPMPTMNPIQRIFARLFGISAYAQNPKLFIETIRFTITKEDAVAECCSSVLFLPGLQGSSLSAEILGVSVPVWPPATPAVFADTLPLLVMSDEGESVHSVFVTGVLDSFYGVPVYGGFVSFMNELVADIGDDINLSDWRPLPYDWRFSPERIVIDGDFVSEVEDAVTSSPTGKVSIIAHSMGGLVGKALIKKLEEEGKAGLVDSFIMVGTPQLGTPQAAAGLLHGDDQAIPGGFSLGGITINLFGNLVVNGATTRAVAQNFPGAYSLLPGARYFDEVSDPAIAFSPRASFTKPWRDYWGDEGISNFLDFFSFLTGGIAREKPLWSITRIPEVLNSDLVTAAANLHADLDLYTIPNIIRVVQIAGWGIPTTKGINYRTKHFLQSYETLKTREGDFTVVYPSALSSEGEKYFFNLDIYREGGRGYVHRNLLNTQIVQQVFTTVLKKEVITENEFISMSKPNVLDLDDLLFLRTNSPVLLGVYDSENRYTGVVPGESPNTQFLLIEENIPDSVFSSESGDQTIYLPKTGTYRFVYQGITEGPTTIETAVFSGDSVIPVATYTDIPTTKSSSAVIVVESDFPETAVVRIDEDGDGVVDLTISPDAENKTFQKLLAELKTLVQNLTSTDKMKNNLLKRIDKLEKKIEKQKVKKSKTLKNLEKQITKKENKGKIDKSSATELIFLINELQTQANIFPLNHEFIAELKSNIESLSVNQGLKNSLLKKAERLLKLSGISQLLQNFIAVVKRKEAKSKLQNEAAQEIFDLLAQLENVL